MSDPLIGKQLGDYVIRQLLGRGGMARVYMGFDERLQRFAAVKVINSDLTTVDEAEYTARFQREARAIARLHHPNIVGVYQFGDYEGSYYMAMVFIEGRDLRQILHEYNERKERMPLKDVLNIVQGIGYALDYAHTRGVIHRDIKPSNIMIDADDQPILTDFGLALSAWEGTLGDTFGSAHYIAPEQAVSSAKAVPQSDLYSLGVCTYEMLTGKVPFDDPSAMSVALKHLNEEPPPPRSLVPDLSPAIEEMVLKSLAKDPEQRYATGADMAQALTIAILGEDASQVPISRVLGAGMKPSDAFGPDSSKPSKPQAMAIPETLVQSETPVKLETASPSEPAAPTDSQLRDNSASAPAAVETKPSILLRPKTETRAAKNAGVYLLVFVSIALIAVVLVLVTGNRGGSATATAATEKTGAPVAMGTAEATLTDKAPPTITARGSLVKITATPRTTLTVMLSPGNPVALTPTRTGTSTKTPTATKTYTLTKTTTPTKTNTPTKTFTLTSTITSSFTATVTATFTPTSTATLTPTLTSTATPSPSETPAGTPVPTSTEPDVLLIYTSDQLNLVNMSSRNLDVGDLLFVQRGLSEERRFPSSRWNLRESVFQPGNLPPNWCFQVGRVDVGPLSTFPECRSLAAFLLASKPNWFWVAADDQTKSFDVLQGDRNLATCIIADGVCKFNIP